MFRVGITSDLVELAERTGAEVGLTLLRTNETVEVVHLDDDGRELEARHLRDLDGLMLLRPKLTATALGDEPRLRLVARWGVGVENIDVPACTERGVMVSTAVDGVRRPIATAMLTLLLALASNLTLKLDLMREGVWSRDAHLGMGLTGRTIGLIGIGNIGKDFLALAAPLDLRVVAYDPYVAPTDMPLGVEAVPLETVMAQSDFVFVCCPLTESTHHLVDAALLDQMKTTACLINVARGPIVDEQALISALQSGRIRGAGLDVFESEPLAADSPLRTMPNVICTPHALGFTDELLRGNGGSAARSLLDVAAGRQPMYLLNPQSLEHPKLQRLGYLASASRA